MDEPLLKPIMRRTGKSAAQVLLRWGLQMGFVILPKSASQEGIEENADIYDFDLTQGEMKILDTEKYEPSAWDPTVIPLDY